MINISAETAKHKYDMNQSTSSGTKCDTCTAEDSTILKIKMTILKMSLQISRLNGRASIHQNRRRHRRHNCRRWRS